MSWKRALLLSVAAAASLAGCVGDTGPAYNIRARQATFTAHGYTNNGPASWWWEYGESRRAVQNGQGTQTPHQGPASSPTNVELSKLVSNLDPIQDYWFRACGQDQKAGSPVLCGQLQHFQTAPGDSSVSATADGTVTFKGANDVRHDFVARIYQPGSNWPRAPLLSEPNQDGSVDPPLGSAIIAGTNCSELASPNQYPDSAYCDVTSSSKPLVATFGPYNDRVDVQLYDLGPVTANLGGGADYFYAASVPVTVHGGTGDDVLGGSNKSDTIYAEDGNDLVVAFNGDDTLFGGPGNDRIYAGAGTDTVDCGPGDDTVYFDLGSSGSTSTGCEHTVTETG